MPLALEPLDDGCFAVTVPADAPWFEGHFPGAPVLPGVVQIGLVQEAASRRDARPRRIEAILRLRLRAPVGPGDELRLRLRGADHIRFEIRRDHQLVAKGEVVLA
jgi:3-hydroxyacyl-[acyl-carrier-protein] dehydratase